MELNLYKNLPTLCRICLKAINSSNSEFIQANPTIFNDFTSIQQLPKQFIPDPICHECFINCDSIRDYSHFRIKSSIYKEHMEANKSALLTYKIVSDILKEDINREADHAIMDINPKNILFSSDSVNGYIDNYLSNNSVQQYGAEISCKLCSGNTTSDIKFSDVTEHKCDLMTLDNDKATTHVKEESCFTTYANQNLLKCKFCTYETLFNSELAVHIKTHKPNKPYKCIECEFRCSSKSYLNIHSRIHTGENPYKCNVCTYSTPFKYSLNVHMRTHVGTKPYRCAQCDFRCSTRGYLETHMRIHTGETPYNCNICGYNTTFKYTLSVHMRKHLGSKPYQCRKCNFKCSSESYLKKHMKAHLKEVYTCNIMYLFSYLQVYGYSPYEDTCREETTLLYKKT